MARKPERTHSQALKASILPQPSVSAVTGPAEGITGSTNLEMSSLEPVTPLTILCWGGRKFGAGAGEEGEAGASFKFQSVVSKAWSRAWSIGRSGMAWSLHRRAAASTFSSSPSSCSLFRFPVGREGAGDIAGDNSGATEGSSHVIQSGDGTSSPTLLLLIWTPSFLLGVVSCPSLGATLCSCSRCSLPTSSTCLSSQCEQPGSAGSSLSHSCTDWARAETKGLVGA